MGSDVCLLGVFDPTLGSVPPRVSDRETFPIDHGRSKRKNYFLDRTDKTTIYPCDRSSVENFCPSGDGIVSP